MTRLSALRGYFGRRDDPYVGGDLDDVQRIGAFLWGLLVLLVVGLLPLSPPHEPSTAAGWAIALTLLAMGVILVIQSHRRRITSWGRLLATAYAIVLGIGLMEWVAGGLGEPYARLFLLPVLFVAATQPLRRIAVFLLFVLFVLISPLFYDGWDSDEAGELLAGYVIWCGLGIGGNLLMSGVRAQRLTHAAGEAEARKEARIDSLTGLHNRRAFDELLLAEVARARRLEIPLSVAMVDIENFKQVNDRWGYAQGDRCLREVAETLRANVRQPDFCFRWGGDEFALILGGTPADETEPIGERLRQKVAQACKRPDDSSIRIRFAAVELGEEISSSELTDMAGLALTTAKLDAAR